jgi:hypothetical protein
MNALVLRWTTQLGGEISIQQFVFGPILFLGGARLDRRHKCKVPSEATSESALGPRDVIGVETS